MFSISDTICSLTESSLNRYPCTLENVFGFATTKSNDVTEDTYFSTSTLLPITIALFNRIMQSIIYMTINTVRFEFLPKFLHAISVILLLEKNGFLLRI